MGFFDLPAPLFGVIDQGLGLVLPALVRLVLWGVLAGWMTMVVYRRLSNQDKIRQLKIKQKKQQKIISRFDGEFEELLPVIRNTLGLGIRQLGLSLGPALLATIPILFIVIWVAGAFGYQQPAVGTSVGIDIKPALADNDRLEWSSPTMLNKTAKGWTLSWPSADQPVSMMQDGQALFDLPFEYNIPVIHKRQWWNWLVANPVGFLPDEALFDSVDIALPPQQFLGFGPDWLRGWMFSFFVTFLLSSVGFKLILKID